MLKHHVAEVVRRLFKHFPTSKGNPMKVSFFVEVLTQALSVLRERQLADSKIDAKALEGQPGEAKAFHLFQDRVKSLIETAEQIAGLFADENGDSDIPASRLAPMHKGLLAVLETASVQLSVQLAQLARKSEDQVIYALEKESAEAARATLLAKADKLVEILQLLTYKSHVLHMFLDARVELLRIAAA